MSRGLIIRLICACIIGVAIVLLGQSARLVKQLEAENIKVQYSSGSPLTGTAFVDIKHPLQTMWLAVSWQWCPRLNIARWCIVANGDSLQAKGNLSLGLSSLSLSNTQISADNIQLILADFIETTATIEANVVKLRLENGNTLAAIKQVDATVLVSDINALGFEFQPHRIKATGGADDDFNLAISGAEANGTLTAKASGAYTTKLALTPADNIAALLKSQLPEAPAGTFSYDYSGVLKVPQ